MTFAIKRSNNAQFFFEIKASNGQILCHSETYTTKQSAQHAIDIIKSEASTAEVIDLT